jgi:tetratricopeptide (TPR) repeat protein
MPHEGSISTKRGIRGGIGARKGAFVAHPLPIIPSFAALRFVAPVVLTLCALSWADERAVLRSGMESVYRMDYAAAEKTFLEGLPATSPRRAFYAGLVNMHRLFDWGDTAALRRAEAQWEPLSPRGEPTEAFRGADPETLRLYRGLAGLQLSYAASLRGQRLRSGMLALAAQRQLSASDAPEARAALMLFGHYRGKVLEKLPFVDPAGFPFEEFRIAAAASGPLEDLFLGSLFWICLEQGRHAEALALSEGFQARYPGNRMARELRAAALFRSGDLAGAREEQEKLWREYLELRPLPGRLPLGRHRAAGNLARIHAALGNGDEAGIYRTEWERAVRGAAGPWLPGSLKRELARP